MDPITAKLMSAAGGAAVDPIYVDDVFGTQLRTGSGSSASSTAAVVNGLDLSGEGGIVWVKERNANNSHTLFSSDVPEVSGKRPYLKTNESHAAGTKSNIDINFNSNGYTIEGNDGQINQNNGNTYVDWAFRKCPGFFDAVYYTGNGSHRDISHNLGSEPGSIWIKRTDSAESWIVYHRSLDPGGGSGATAHFAKIELESTGTQFGGTLHWSTSGGGEDHTASTFHVGSHAAVNGSGASYVAILFAHDDQSFGDGGDEAIIKCASYTGNGTTSNEVNVGFEPQWLLIKTITASGHSWYIFDTMRGIVSGANDASLLANADNAEDTSFSPVELTPSGFKLTHGSTNAVNGNNQTYIYIAIRRPHKPAEDSTDVLDIVQHSGNSTARHIAGTSGSKPADMHIIRRVNTSGEPSFIGARLLGPYSFPTDDDSKEAASTNKYGGSSANPWDVMTGINLDTDAAMNTSGNTYINYFLTRHPGVFEAVTYEGNGANRTISHNLGVAPDLMIFRNLDRSSGQKTPVYVSGITHLNVFGSDPDSYGSNPGLLLLNAVDKAQFSAGGFFNHTHPTSSVFTVGDTFHINENAKTHIAFLFSNLAGICKIGTYTGAGGSTDVDVDCGFTSGARLIIIKKATNISAWRVFDTTRGINSGTESYWFFDNATTPATFDVIDPINSGFRVVNENAASQGFNASGHVYIFMAFS